MIFLVISLGLLLLSSVSAGVDFSYRGSRGPAHWAERYDTCVGKHQSPINIEEHDVKNITLPPLRFIGLENPRSSFLTNNGHTVMLRANESDAAMISGGPIGDETYVFEQLHFHWGRNDREGSEDLINNHSFAMELHAVFYKKAYRTMAEATNHPDGLVVLAYFYETGNDTNPTYEPIVDVLPNAEPVGAKNDLQEPLILTKLIVPDPSATQNYYTYQGSLTTPPCLEIVTWIDFVEPQLLSHEQLAAFRNVRATDGGKLTHNFRPIQPLVDRVVYHNNLNADNTESNSIPHGNHHHKTRTGKTGGAHSGQRGITASIYHISLAVLFGVIFPVL